MAEADESPGGQGEPPSRADLDLWRQALRNDWAIPPPVKRRLLQTAINLADPDAEEELPARTPGADRPETYTVGQRVKLQAVRDRTKLAALRVLAQFAKLNAQQAAVDLAREKFEHEKAEASGGSGMAEVHDRMAAYVDPDEPDGRPGAGPGVVQGPAEPV